MAKRNEGTRRVLRRREEGWRKAEGGDCRRKDGRALRKGSLGSEGEKEGDEEEEVEKEDGEAEGRSNDALSHAESLAR